MDAQLLAAEAGNTHRDRGVGGSGGEGGYNGDHSVDGSEALSTSTAGRSLPCCQRARNCLERAGLLFLDDDLESEFLSQAHHGAGRRIVLIVILGLGSVGFLAQAIVAAAFTDADLCIVSGVQFAGALLEVLLHGLSFTCKQPKHVVRINAIGAASHWHPARHALLRGW